MTDHEIITAERGRRAADLRAAAVAALEQQSIAAGVMLDLDSDQVVVAGPKAAILMLLSTDEGTDRAAEAAQPASTDLTRDDRMQHVRDIMLDAALQIGGTTKDKLHFALDLLADLESKPLSRPATTSGEAPDLQQLKALALAATPGPWELRATEWSYYAVEAAHPNWGAMCEVAPSRKSNMEFIVAANPAVVLDLIARIESAAAPAPSDWTIHDPHGVIARVLAASHAMLAAACKHIGYKDDNELSKAATDLDNALADAVGIEDSIVAASPATASGDDPRWDENGEPWNEAAEKVERERAAVSAATKPTADSQVMARVHAEPGETPRAVLNSIGRALPDNTPLYAAAPLDPAKLKKLVLDVSNTSFRCGQLSAGEDETPDAYTKATAADEALINYVQSLLATKPAAQAVPEGFVLMPKRLTQAMRDVLTEGEWEWPDFLAAAEVITEDEYNQLIGNDTLAAAPLSADAAQEQARNDALEEAAKLFDVNPHAEQFHCNIAEQIRELKGAR